MLNGDGHSKGRNSFWDRGPDVESVGSGGDAGATLITL